MADQAIKDKITRILRKKFPHDTVDVSDGYKDNIHVVVVSREFQDIPESHKRELLWDLLDESDLTDEEKTKISLMLPYSPTELK